MSQPSDPRDELKKLLQEHYDRRPALNWEPDMKITPAKPVHPDMESVTHLRLRIAELETENMRMRAQFGLRTNEMHSAVGTSTPQNHDRACVCDGDRATCPTLCPGGCPVCDAAFAEPCDGCRNAWLASREAMSVARKILMKLALRADAPIELRQEIDAAENGLWDALHSRLSDTPLLSADARLSRSGAGR